MTVTPDQVAADLLLDELADRGITVKIHAGNLALWPRDRLTSGLRGRLQEHKPELVRALRLAALDEDQRDAWQERVAICVIDSGLSETEAEAVAWREIEAAQESPDVAETEDTEPVDWANLVFLPVPFPLDDPAANDPAPENK